MTKLLLSEREEILWIQAHAAAQAQGPLHQADSIASNAVLALRELCERDESISVRLLRGWAATVCGLDLDDLRQMTPDQILGAVADLIPFDKPDSEIVERETAKPRSRWSLKRLAWAYGCAKKGSTEERKLGIELVARVWGSDERRAPQRFDHCWTELFSTTKIPPNSSLVSTMFMVLLDSSLGL